MPNYCQNEMFVKGSKEQLENFLVDVKGEDGDFDFQKIVPMPLSESANWYEWRNEHWGTKWNAGDAEKGDIEISENGTDYQVRIFFTTAWNFPGGVFDKLAEVYPQLKFYVEVDEEGGFFWGDVTISDGLVTENLKEGVRPNGPYDYSSEEDDINSSDNAGDGDDSED